MIILEGTKDFLINDSRNIAISSEKAKQLFGNESPTGKKITMWRQEYTISAVVSGMSKKSNYTFDILQSFPLSVLDPDGKSVKYIKATLPKDMSVADLMESQRRIILILRKKCYPHKYQQVEISL